MPLYGAQGIDHVSSTGRDATTLVGPGAVVSSHNVKSFVGVGADFLRPRGDNGVTARTKVEEIANLDGEWCPAGDVVVQVCTCHDGIGTKLHVLSRGSQISPIATAPVRSKHFIFAK